jgi:hypothetical protein
MNRILKIWGRYSWGRGVLYLKENKRIMNQLLFILVNGKLSCTVIWGVAYAGLG